EVGYRVIDWHPHHEFRAAAVLALVEQVVEQLRAVIEAVEVGAEAEVEDLPGIRSQGGGLRLDESLDRPAARLFHHIHVVGVRGDRQNRGEGAVQQEPESGRGELTLERRGLCLTHLLPVEGLDRTEVLQLRGSDLERHRALPSSVRKYWCQRRSGVNSG